MLLSKDSNIIEVTHNCTGDNLLLMLENGWSPMLSVNFVTEDINVDSDWNNIFGDYKVFLRKDKLDYGENIIAFAFDILSQKYDSLDELMDLYKNRFGFIEWVNWEEDFLTITFASVYIPNYWFLWTQNDIVLAVYKAIYTEYLHESEDINIYHLENVYEFYNNYDFNEIKEYYIENFRDIINWILDKSTDINEYWSVSDIIESELEFYNFPLMYFQKNILVSIISWIKKTNETEDVIINIGNYLIYDLFELTYNIISNIFYSIKEYTDEDLEYHNITRKDIEKIEKKIEILKKYLNKDVDITQLKLDKEDMIEILDLVSPFFYIQSNEYTEWLVFPQEETNTVPLDYWEKVKVNEKDWNEYDKEYQEWVKNILQKYNIKLEIEK